MAVVHQAVHLFSQQLFRVGIAQQVGAGTVGKDAMACFISAVDSLNG